MKPTFNACVAILIACFAATAVITCFEGCSTSQQTAAYQSASGLDASVRLAMTGWGAFVAVKHPSTNEEFQVLQAFNAVKTAELGVIDTETQLSTNALATNAVVTSGIILSNAQVTLLKTISQFTNSP
jgi:hypothetical protein